MLRVITAFLTSTPIDLDIWKFMNVIFFVHKVDKNHIENSFIVVSFVLTEPFYSYIFIIFSKEFG